MKRPHILPLLPPKIDYSQLIKEIGDANRAIGELKGLLARLPNPSLLTTPLLTKEAVASSKIEGTQATIEEVFIYEAEGKNTERDSREQDIREIINYRIAIQDALELIKKRPVGENFIKQLHSTLLNSVRGENKDRGNFRRIPVFIGKPGAKMEDAIYIPPNANELPNLLSNWERYVNSENEPDPIVQIAIAHYQLEAIHPFLDGNGRIGRLLIPIMLYYRNLLTHPILYVSEFFENNREEYYYNLRQVDEKEDWISWIRYFLNSITVQSLDTQKKVLNMYALYSDVKEKLVSFNSQYAVPLLDIIFAQPIVSVSFIKEKLPANSKQTIYNLLEKFENEKILEEITVKETRLMYSESCWRL